MRAAVSRHATADAWARRAPALISLAAGLALWEIAGRMTSAAFLGHA